MKGKTKKTIKDKKLIDWKWIITISVTSFVISLLFSTFGEVVIPKVHLVFSILILIAFILIGIGFDILGIAVTVADIRIFNSMAAKKVRGATLAVNLIKNSDKVASFFNDVIGDICGIVSGSTGVAIALILNSNFHFNLLLTTLLVTAIVSMLTIGGKAIGKSYAINKCNDILYRFIKIISIFYRK
jgi:CBS domain containing-hemolysin-like protein